MPSIPKVFDRLSVMFQLQKEFQELSDNGQFPRLSGEHVAQFALGVYTELGEILQEYKGWKPWKNSDCYTYNEEAVKKELADTWHFMINITLALGYDADDMYKIFYDVHDKLLDERFRK